MIYRKPTYFLSRLFCFPFGLLNKFIKSLPLQITINESIKDLCSLQLKYGELIGKKLRAPINISGTRKYVFVKVISNYFY